MTIKCSCAQDIDTCPAHDWRNKVEIPDRREELRQREIRRGMRMTSSHREKRQEF